MVVGRAVAGLAVQRTDSVAVLRDLERSPTAFGQGGNEAGNYAGLAYAAGMSADDDDCHISLIRRRGRPRHTATFFLLTVPVRPTLSDILAPAWLAFPRTQFPSLLVFCWAGRQFVLPA